MTGFREIDAAEMQQVQGGGWWGDLVNWVSNRLPGVVDVYKAVVNWLSPRGPIF